ncbi:MAG: IPT/TIG domain-containing protein, partial [Dehalococcoidia bacterium]|nr:IPT/TIG domain-containing protein [Dehalococcoidia bacterium]
MKCNKIFRTLAVAIIISLLALVLPATPAAAAAITLSPTSGRAGSTVTVTGEGFTSGNTVRIEFQIDSTYSSRRWLDPVIGTTFSTTFTVPTTASVGTHLVRAYDEDAATVLASAYFTVISPEIDIYPDEGPVGTEVEIEGTNFYSREDITFEYDGDDIEIDSGDDDTDSDGDFTSYIIIPDSTAGDHTITVTGDDSNLEAEAEFTVDSETSISPTSGAAGTEVTVSGTGFEDDEDITIYFAGSKIDTTPTSVETDDLGSFSGIFIVPVKVRDTYTVKASDGTNKHSVDFTITAGTSLSSTTGNVDTELTVSGTGFIANGTVTIKYDETQIATATTDADGAFST